MDYPNSAQNVSRIAVVYSSGCYAGYLIVTLLYSPKISDPHEETGVGLRYIRRRVCLPGQRRAVRPTSSNFPRPAPCVRDFGVASWHESQGGFGSLGPFQRHHHLGHLFPCPAQHAGRVGHRGGEPTEAQLVGVSQNLWSTFGRRLAIWPKKKPRRFLVYGASSCLE